MTNVNSFAIKTEVDENVYNVNFQNNSTAVDTKVELAPVDKSCIYSDLNNNGSCYDNYRFNYNRTRRESLGEKCDKFSKRREYGHCCSKFAFSSSLTLLWVHGIIHY